MDHAQGSNAEAIAKIAGKPAIQTAGLLVQEKQAAEESAVIPPPPPPLVPTVTATATRAHPHTITYMCLRCPADDCRTPPNTAANQAANMRCRGGGSHQMWEGSFPMDSSVFMSASHRQSGECCCPCSKYGLSSDVMALITSDCGSMQAHGRRSTSTARPSPRCEGETTTTRARCVIL